MNNTDIEWKTYTLLQIRSRISAYCYFQLFCFRNFIGYYWKEDISGASSTWISNWSISNNLKMNFVIKSTNISLFVKFALTLWLYHFKFVTAQHLRRDFARRPSHYEYNKSRTHQHNRETTLNQEYYCKVLTESILITINCYQYP